MTEEENFASIVDGIEIDIKEIAKEGIKDIFDDNPRVSAIIGLLQFGRNTVGNIYKEAQENGMNPEEMKDDEGKTMSDRVLLTIYACLEIIDPSIKMEEFVEALRKMEQIDGLLEEAFSED
jgi:hypothetical protein